MFRMTRVNWFKKKKRTYEPRLGGITSGKKGKNKGMKASLLYPLEERNGCKIGIIFSFFFYWKR
ncbi:Hypothetical protein Minf_1521 [Methylacidiphilum infernorum V4]|uniref:Uncharacterized protein n=1 Tax=Methylacidiphilum infernorum (isolate V4) TaxID=481448 RepID=B3DW72_METI4|nr:Hypothetical protein Minf_1521 [Methylacidiphilum infernorum V4]